MSEKLPPDYFGTRTGTHTHPATHPNWLVFSDGNCPVCGTTDG